MPEENKQTSNQRKQDKYRSRNVTYITNVIILHEITFEKIYSSKE